MRVAVIGAGLFGCTAAIHLARAGHQVELFDRAKDIMTGATFSNQLRLHRGYHYPRSPATGAECRAGLVSFEREYGEAIRTGGDQFYAVATRGGRVSQFDYHRFLDAEGLEYENAGLAEPTINREAIGFAVRVNEGFVDIGRLIGLVRRNLDEAGVRVRLGMPGVKWPRDKYDRFIVAAYAGNNKVLELLGCETEPAQYEIVEKPVVRLSDEYRDTGVVVMDGPFGCIDPYGTTGLHLMGHVKWAIWSTNTGRKAEVPIRYLRPYINRGIIERPCDSRFEVMRSDLSRYLPFVAQAEHAGSMFTVRVVLPGRDATDERPTLVRWHDEQVASIFSGKLGTAVDAAERLVAGLHESGGYAPGNMKSTGHAA